MKEGECQRGRQKKKATRKNQIVFPAGNESSEEIRAVLAPSAIRTEYHFFGELPSDVCWSLPLCCCLFSSFSPCLSTSFHSISFNISLIVSVSLTLTVGGLLPTALCLILFPSLCQSYLLSVTEVITAVPTSPLLLCRISLLSPRLFSFQVQTLAVNH